MIVLTASQGTVVVWVLALATFTLIVLACSR